MKRSVILFLCFLATTALYSQSVEGAWERYDTNDAGEKLKSVVVFTEGYQVLTVYKADTGEFVHTNGGSYVLNGTTMTEVCEFNSDQEDAVGKEVSFEIELTDNSLGIKGYDMDFKRIDNGTPGELQGAWLMSGRKRNGEIQQRDTSRPRKTMKILSGTRFQWIAYNTETKQFMATGGGTYTTVDGKYTENIEFFSRDNSRVGASLEFDFSLQEGNWHHSGFSSKGDPLYEIWSERE